MANQTIATYQEPPLLEEKAAAAMQVVGNQQPATQQQTGYALFNTDSMLHLSNELKRFITEQKLASNIQGKQYVNVEGWQYAGAQLRLTCIVDAASLQDLSSGNEIRYRVTARVYDLRTGDQVAEASASCSNKEPGKQGYQHFAVESMAQTRAVSKAYRTNLGWLIKAAGFEATPYEEMTAHEEQAVVMASSQQIQNLFKLCQAPEITSDDFPEETKDKIQKGDLTEKEAKELTRIVQNLIDERCY